MRPELLYSLFSSVTVLPGIGKRTAALIEKLAGSHVVDLLWHLPVSIINRQFRPNVVDAPDGQMATLEVVVDQHLAPQSRKQPYKVRCSDTSGFLTLVFFHPRVDYLQRVLPQGQTVIISGRVEHYYGEIQITHPDYIMTIEQAVKELPMIEPVYPLTTGLTSKTLLKAIRQVTTDLPDLPEWHDATFLAQQTWPTWRDAVTQVHLPKHEADLEPDHPARMRLAYDELLANQLALALMRHHMRRKKGRVLKGTGALTKKVLNALPYTLTPAQDRSVAEILQDMDTPTRMMRLLQGDVGSGKTVVALLAMVSAIEAGSQAAIMAPTEILAHQHLAFFKPLCEHIGLHVDLLTGRDKGRDRERILEDLANGTTHILIGTHALFQEGVTFHDLGLAIVDEQHRFGVHQRLQLSGKGGASDVLVMTATPIPRTLTLTAYGDMDVSRLDEKPPGRKPVTTRAVSLDRLDDVVNGIRRALKTNNQIYWVCPLVEESEVISATAAEDRYAHLQLIFGNDVALIHGRMRSTEKEEVMAQFQSGAVKILVATTVIEVGVDVPNASIMVIEHAERFGLAQLHQLRGRVGRGDAAASCILLYKPPLGETAKARLKIMRETDDGFVIAEEDLRLRGAGDILGTRQSGLPEFRLADLEAHRDLLFTARDDAALILNKDSDLSTERGEALRVLLYLFEQDEAVRYLQAG